MANIALSKKPLESVWTRPEESTNGIVTGYTGDKGFSDADYPANYTIELGKMTTIHTIRFLLWDGINTHPVQTIDSRQYFYSLSISNDNETWDTYYNTTDQGFNGWQIFTFAKNIQARYVRLTGKYNTKNKGFHIVEFEVHDSAPPALPQNAHITNRKFLIEPIVDNNLFVRQLQDFITNRQDVIFTQSTKLLDKLTEDTNAAKKLKEQLNERVGEFDETIQQLNLAGKSIHFLDEASKIKSNSQKWLYATIASFCLFLGLIFYFLCSGNLNFTKISCQVSRSGINESLINKTVLFEFGSYLILKALLVSLAIYAIVFCAKNYRIQMHNYTINQHKSMSLYASVELLDNDKLTTDTREEILVQATTTIFAHQNSGYNTKDADLNPNILASTMDKISKATGK
jgi:hypothetical protein